MIRTFDDLLPTPLDADRLAALSPLTDSGDLLALLDRWVERGWLRALDRAFVSFLRERAPEGDPLVLLAAALASHQLGHGHVCLDVQKTLEEPDFALSLPPEGDALAGPLLLPSQLLERLSGETWLERLHASPLVAAGGSAEHLSRPLVLSEGRLYLRRYWTYERQIDRALRQRLPHAEAVPTDLRARLDNLFQEGAEPGQIDWQKLACALATRAGFSIITGGPGTGKTTTVVRLLALLQAPAVEAGRPLRIRLAAPTGKAAARLTESIGQQVERLRVSDEVRRQIPSDVSTVHRLLGSRPNSRHFRHHAGDPLPLDVLVVDEASMIDLEMMANLLAAMPENARLILLGDKDQLASVEAGAVLGDLCRDAEEGRYSPETQVWLEQVSGESLTASGLEPGDTERYPLAQQVVMLRRSRRFGEGSGIGQLARLVNRQAGKEARELLERGGYDDVFVRTLSGEQDRKLDRLVLDGLERGPKGPLGYRDYLLAIGEGRPAADLPADDPSWSDWALNVLKAFECFQLLCAVRRGPWGVEGLNQRVSRVLTTAGLIDGDQPWYEGRPVLVTRNDYGLNLMNGDIGIALRVPDGQSDVVPLRVAFPRNDGRGGVRFVLPSRLNEVETVFAMTVHKSQGSEFAHTALVLPDALNPVLTKELIYTGITRAKDWFSLVEPRKGVLEEAVGRKVKRISGLMLERG